MYKPDFTHPRRMSPGAIFILFTKAFVRLLAPFVGAAFVEMFNSGAIGAFKIILLCLGGCMAFSIIYALALYLTKKFYIKDGNLIFMHGLINREDTCVPLDRVHSLRTQKGLWYRLLDMRGIIFDTLATRQEEIELILDEYEWQNLLQVIADRDKQINSDAATGDSGYDATHTVRYSTKKLLLDALCQNHLKGMAVLLSLLVVVIDNIPDLPERTTRSAGNYLEAYFGSLTDSPLSIVLLLAYAYLGILIMWLGKVVLRYYDMVMGYDKRLLTFTYGMLTRSSCRFLYDKICTIRIKRNILEKKFGLCTLMLKQALNVSAEKEDDNMKLYGADSSSFFLTWWLGEDYAHEGAVMAARSGKGVIFHSILPGMLIAVAASVILSHLQLYLWMFIPAAYMLLLLPKGVYAMRRSKITLHSSYLAVYDGSFAEVSNFIKYSDLEVVRLRRTPFTKWFHRVSLVLSTPGTTYVVRSIKEEEAILIYELLLMKADDATSISLT